MQIRKYDIVLVNLDPAVGAEKKGVRPCVVVQNNQANRFSETTVVCPLSTTLKHYPNNLIINPSSQNQLKQISCLDILQIKTVDKSRIRKKWGMLDERYHDELSAKFFVSFDLEDLLY
ncbi:MAG: type II toxin-antitoxin system PemK/MazF family toxin [Candidatus Peregrinibacteria bacterium]